jgi:choline dehydrogenase-like flavoprotein
VKSQFLSILFVAVPVVALPALADDRQTHRALLELFTPTQWSSSKSMEQQSWSAMHEDPSCKELWKRVEPLGQLPLAKRQKALNDLAHSKGDGPARYLQARQLYLGWIYDGQRGRSWAGLPEPVEGSVPTAKPPKMAAAPFQISQNQIALKDGQLDYLIVGSGPAGSVLGHQLSAAGLRVALVERGSFVLPDLIDTREVSQLKVGGGAVPTNDFGVLLRNAEVIGGGSTVNVDLAFAPTLPMVSQRIESWRKYGYLGPNQWSRQNVRAAYDWVAATIGTRQPTQEEINPNNRVLWDGATALGLQPALYALNTWPARPTHLDKRSAVNGLLLEAMSRPSRALWVLPDLDARTILTENGRAVGLELKAKQPWKSPAVWVDPHHLQLKAGQTYQLKARRIIVCAGAQGSAALLMRSKLGGPAVGKGIVLHPSLPLVGRFSRKIDATVGTPSTVYAVDPLNPTSALYECMSGGPQYVALMLFGSANEIGQLVHNFRNLAGFGVMLVDSVDDHNCITLGDDGEPTIHYRLTPPDKVRFAQAASKAAQMMLAGGATEVYLPSAEPYLGKTSAGRIISIKSAAQATQVAHSLHFLPGQTLVTAAHMQSSCKMGSDPQHSVVNPDHQVWGVDGLYVCDSSIFPSSVGANPMQTIYTVAKLFADRLVSDESYRH